ncbi:ethylene-responsive RNA helicase, putative [Babesia caballi]|uniref:RNA helicase n=1 Tax=Babesia caballi TaxID=5871 RepID=A0AAV4LTF8_BABCB|nr:ethylene-responsive RNA helicase, putative [Babesia caballi]
MVLGLGRVNGLAFIGQAGREGGCSVARYLHFNRIRPATSASTARRPTGLGAYGEQYAGGNVAPSGGGYDYQMGYGQTPYVAPIATASAYSGPYGYGNPVPRVNPYGAAQYGYSSYGGHRQPYGTFSGGYNNQQALKLPSIDWSGKQLVEIKKDFYDLSPDANNRPGEEIEAILASHGIIIDGETPLPKPVNTFDEAVFNEPIQRIIKQMGFVEPTPIQKVGWTSCLTGRDVVGVSQTGSGKTLAFLLPGLLHLLAQPPVTAGMGPVILVLAPTRELCQQTYSEAMRFMRVMNLRGALLYGGVPKSQQQQQLVGGVDIMVATPGRLIDCLSTGMVRLDRVSYFVLDEADRMLDMGFEPQIRMISSQVRPDRQTLLFSATWPSSIRRLASEFCKNNCIYIQVGDKELTANPNINQQVRVLRSSETFPYLCDFLAGDAYNKKVLIFVESRIGADNLVRDLSRRGLNALSIHGNKSQNQRDHTIRQFRTGAVNIMVATDVASRGLDIKDIDYVVNMDAPTSIESYIHRQDRAHGPRQQDRRRAAAARQRLPRPAQGPIRPAAGGRAQQRQPAGAAGAAAARAECQLIYVHRAVQRHVVYCILYLRAVLEHDRGPEAVHGRHVADALAPVEQHDDLVRLGRPHDLHGLRGNCDVVLVDEHVHDLQVGVRLVLYHLVDDAQLVLVVPVARDAHDDALLDPARVRLARRARARRGLGGLLVSQRAGVAHLVDHEVAVVQDGDVNLLNAHHLRLHLQENGELHLLDRNDVAEHALVTPNQNLDRLANKSVGHAELALGAQLGPPLEPAALVEGVLRFADAHVEHHAAVDDHVDVLLQLDEALVLPQVLDDALLVLVRAVDNQDLVARVESGVVDVFGAVSEGAAFAEDVRNHHLDLDVGVQQDVEAALGDGHYNADLPLGRLHKVAEEVAVKGAQRLEVDGLLHQQQVVELDLELLGLLRRKDHGVLLLKVHQGNQARLPPVDAVNDAHVVAFAEVLDDGGRVDPEVGDARVLRLDLDFIVVHACDMANDVDQLPARDADLLAQPEQVQIGVFNDVRHVAVIVLKVELLQLRQRCVDRGAHRESADADAQQQETGVEECHVVVAEGAR